jgi:hypothetical protein
MILVPLIDLKFLNELAAGDAGTSNRRHWMWRNFACLLRPMSEIPQGHSTLRIVNLPDAGARGGMHMHLLTRNRRPRALMEASGIALRCGPTFHFRPVCF